jgi:hypothetical protein
VNRGLTSVQAEVFNATNVFAWGRSILAGALQSRKLGARNTSRYAVTSKSNDKIWHQAFAHLTSLMDLNLH